MHMKKNHSDAITSHTCKICKNEYKTAKGLRFHLLTHTKSKREVECDTCGNTFYTKIQCLYHLQAVHSPQEYPCECCGKVFRRKEALNVHVKYVHLKFDEKVPCPICGNTFPSQSNMRKHLRMIHDDVQCAKCGERFSGQKKLTRHELVKHQNMRYKCMIPGCTKEYLAKAKVTKHFRNNHHDLTPEQRAHYDKIRKHMKATLSYQVG